MGGQACVFYGAAQFSKDIDLVLLASQSNFQNLLAAIKELNAERIAVPRFDPVILARGHAVHFRCRGGEADGLRVDIMTHLRGLPDFDTLWFRRTTITGEAGETFELIGVEDLVQAKKTQRQKDWPVIDALVEGHYKSLHEKPTPDRIAFWLKESRTPERLIQLVESFPAEARSLSSVRPLLQLALQHNSERLRAEIDAETRAEQEKDRAYWAPLKAEMEEFRRQERLTQE